MDRIWCRNREWSDFALSRRGQAIRRETGMPRPVMMFNTLQATLVSVFCVEESERGGRNRSPFCTGTRHLRQRAFPIVERSLPSQPATLLDQLDVSVALGRGGFGRVARHRG